MSKKFIRKLEVGLVLVLFFTLVSGCISILVIFGDRSMLFEVQKISAVERERELEISLDGDGYYNIVNDDSGEPVKVLQLTDLHITCSVARKTHDSSAIAAVVNLVESTKPDLIVLTGDNIFPFWLWGWCTNSFLQVQVLGTLMERLAVPWAVIYGNHDPEGRASKSYMSDYYSSLSVENGGNCLFQAGPEDITGEGNYVIKVLNSDRSLNSGLVLMDTNNRTSTGGRDHVHSDQIDWYETEIGKLNDQYRLTAAPEAICPTMLFIHIPFAEYDEALDLYNQGSDAVTFHFGRNDELFGGAPESPGFYDTLAALGSTKWVFCGHHHMNTWSITLNDTGITLTYGMSIDYTYPFIKNRTIQRGGTVIFIDTDGSVVIKQAPQTNNWQILE